MNFGVLVKNARELKGWRQEDLAEALGVTQQAVQKWEASSEPPFRSQYLGPLCETLGLDLPEPPKIRTYLKTPIRTQIELPGLPVARERDAPRQRPAHPDEIMVAVREHLPEELRQYVNAPLAVAKRLYKFQYFSPRVVLTIVSGTHLGAPPLRSIGWRLALAQKVLNDRQVQQHHYGAIVVALPGQVPHSTTITPALQQEFDILDINLFEVPSPEAAAAMIQKLENKPTEFDQFMENMPDFDDDLGDLV